MEVMAQGAGDTVKLSLSCDELLCRG